MKILAPLLLASLLFAACNNSTETSNDDGSKPTIATVNYPLAYFAERLAGDSANILFDAPADEDPAFWEPTDADIAKIKKADLILLNGATYAKWTEHTELPFETSVVTSEAFEDKLIKTEDGDDHAHEDGEEDHSHGGIAFTTWMDFKQAALQAKAVADALTESFPDQKDAIAKNLTALEADLAALDKDMAAATAKLKSAPVIASHPVYQYWERAYGLKVPSLMWEPEMDLDDKAMAALKAVQDANPGTIYFVWEGDPLPGHIEKLKGAGLKSLVVSPSGNRPEEGDFLSVMKANIAAINDAVK